MPLQDLTELPDPPARSDPPDDFIAKADALLSSLPTFVTQLNTLATQLEVTAALIAAAPAYADPGLVAMTGKTPAADKLIYFTGVATSALATLTAAARTFMGAADASAQLDALGVSAFIKTLLNDADAATARATLGAPGVGEYQPLDSDLSAIALLVTTSFGRNLLTLADAAAGRSAFGSNAALGYGSNGSGDFVSVPIAGRTYYFQWGTGTTGANGWGSALDLPFTYTTAGEIWVSSKSPNSTAIDGNKVSAELVSLSQYRLGSDDVSATVSWFTWGY